MAYGALDARGSRAVLLCDLGIKHLGDGVYHFHVVYGENDGLAQILVALDVGGDADLVDDVRDHGLKLGLLPRGRGRGLEVVPRAGVNGGRLAAELTDAREYRGGVAGLGYEVVRAQHGAVGHHLGRYEAGYHDDPAIRSQLRQTAHHLKPVHPRQHQLEKKYVRLEFRYKRQGFGSVRGDSRHLEIFLGSDPVRQQRRKVHVGIYDQNARLGFHNLSSSQNDMEQKYARKACFTLVSH